MTDGCSDDEGDPLIYVKGDVGGRSGGGTAFYGAQQGVIDESGRLPGSSALARLPTSPNMFGVPACTATSKGRAPRLTSAAKLMCAAPFASVAFSAVASEEQYDSPMAEPVQVVLQGVVVEGEVMGVVDKEY